MLTCAPALELKTNKQETAASPQSYGLSLQSKTYKVTTSIKVNILLKRCNGYRIMWVTRQIESKIKEKVKKFNVDCWTIR